MKWGDPSEIVRPPIAGPEDPLAHRRLTDSYFKIINEEWQPQIIDDIHLPFQVYQAGKKINWSQRENVSGNGMVSKMA